MTRSTWFDDTVRGGFFLRISSIRTVRNTFSTDCHRSLRRGAVRFFLFDNPTVRCGAFVFFNGAVRRGLFFLEFYGAVRCGAVLLRGKIVRCGAVRLNLTKPHRTVSKNRTVKSLGTLLIGPKISHARGQMVHVLVPPWAEIIFPIPFF